MDPRIKDMLQERLEAEKRGVRRTRTADMNPIHTWEALTKRNTRIFGLNRSGRESAQVLG